VGTVHIIDTNGALQPEPFVELPIADYLGLDWGVTGLALDPDFSTNSYVYVFYTEPVRTETVNDESGSKEVPIGKPVIVRYTESGGTATEETILAEDFPETDVNHPGFNANGEIHFGPDGMLYASMGDYDVFETNPGIIADLSSPIGKLLRMNPDGTAPTDNPFAAEPAADQRVYATGFREPFAFTFSETGTLYATDNTTVSCEELNVIEAGASYGWPEMGAFPFSDCAAAPGEQPIYHLTREGTAPGDFLSFVEASSLQFLAQSTYTQLTDGLMVCESQRSAVENVVTAGVLRRLTLTADTTVSASDPVVTECKGVVAVNEGIVYYATDNQLKRLTEGPGGVSPAGGSPAGTTETNEQTTAGQQPPTAPSP
jgi:glucose/arabinose dehydrogenase